MSVICCLADSEEIPQSKARGACRVLKAIGVPFELTQEWRVVMVDAEGEQTVLDESCGIHDIPGLIEEHQHLEAAFAISPSDVRRIN